MSWRYILSPTELEIIREIDDHLLLGIPMEHKWEPALITTIFHLCGQLDYQSHQIIELQSSQPPDMSPDRPVTRMDMDAAFNIERGRMKRMFAYELCDAIKKAFNVP